MPMVRHEAVRKKCHVASLHGFLEQPDEGGAIQRIFKKHGAFGGSVEYVKHQPRRPLSHTSRHEGLSEATPMPQAWVVASVLQK